MEEAPPLSLLQLPDDLLFCVLAACAPQPAKQTSLLAVCRRFFRILSERAPSLTLSGPPPSPAFIALLRSAAAVRRLDITECEGTWPLTQLLPHLPRVECVVLQPSEASIPLLPPTLPQVHVRRVSIGSPDELDLVARVRDHLDNGAVVIHELCDEGLCRPPAHAGFLDSGPQGVRAPLVKRAHLMLKHAPACVRELTTLTALALYETDDHDLSKTSVPSAIGALAQLRQLELRNCRGLATLPGEIAGLAALTRLDVQNCAVFSTLPAELGELRALEELSLEALPRLTSLPPKIGRLPALKHLALSNCPSLESLPPTICCLSALTALKIVRCDAMASLPDAVSSLRCLQLLSFSSRASKHFPAALLKLTSLRSATLPFTAPDARDLASLSVLTSLHALEISLARVRGICPPFVAQLPGLTSLTLRGCRDVTGFAEDMSALSDLRVAGMGAQLSLPRGAAPCLQSLRSLFLLRGAFDQLPDAVAAAASLSLLCLDHCEQLAELPATLAHLPKLQHLNLRNCTRLATLRADAVGSCTALRSLNIWYDKPSSLTTLPGALGALSSLTRLWLHGCDSLRKLPDSLGSLAALCELHVTFCTALEVLPASLGGLTALYVLNARDCRSLEALPDDVGRLPSLKHLLLPGCWALRVLPRTLGGLSSLRTLNLCDCAALRSLPATLAALRALHLHLGHAPLPQPFVGAVADLCEHGCVARLEVGGRTYAGSALRNGVEALRGL